MPRQFAGFLVVACILIDATTTFAQTPSAPDQGSARPYRGLFGSGVSNTEQLLTFNLSLLGGNVTSVETGRSAVDPSTGAPLPSALQSVRTSFEQATVGLNYALTRARATVSASASTNGTYYQSLGKTIFSSTGGVSASFRVSPRTSLSAAETISYQPLFFSNTFPTLGGLGVGQPIIPDTTTGVRLDNYETQSTTVSAEHRLSRRVDASLGYARVENTFAGDDGTQTQSVIGRISFDVTRHLSFYVGDSYFANESRSAGVSTTSRGQVVNFGVGYNRLASISLSRHLKLAVGGGLSAVSDGDSRQYTVVGSAILTYEIGRSWGAAAGLNRQVGFVSFFQLPVTTDGAIAQIGGLIVRRLMFQASAGASKSSVGFGGPSNGYTTEYASASLTFGLSRTLGVGVGYADYSYRFDAGLQLPTGVLDHTNSQSVYAFLNLWEPLFATRSRNAAR